LLKHFGLDKALISCHEHNEETAADKIVALLKDGKKVAYVSDAGYPVISDPGERLAKRCLKEGIKVAVINGPNAGICALVGSGLASDHFMFYGFLPSKPSERKKELAKLTSHEETLIFYESPHRIKKTLQDFREAFGSDRKACLCRELTKAHEEYIHASLGELAELDETTLLGEMVLIVEGQKPLQKTIGNEEVVHLLEEKLKTMRPKEAVNAVSKENAIPKNRVYELFLSEIKSR